MLTGSGKLPPYIFSSSLSESKYFKYIQNCAFMFQHILSSFILQKHEINPLGSAVTSVCDEFEPQKHPWGYLNVDFPQFNRHTLGSVHLSNGL